MADEEAYKKSLQKLSRYLHNHYQQKVIILIDEYDAPIHVAYTHKYYEKLISFMRYNIIFCIER